MVFEMFTEQALCTQPTDKTRHSTTYMYNRFIEIMR